MPERLLVIGGDYIGLELGHVYAALGSHVTLVEMTDGLLPGARIEWWQPAQRREWMGPHQNASRPMVMGRRAVSGALQGGADLRRAGDAIAL